MTGKVSLMDVFGQRQLLNDAVRPAGDRADCHHLVEDCIGNDDVANPHDALLAGERAKSSDGGDFIIVGAPQSHEAYGCMMRKDDPEFKKVVDDAIAAVETSGEADRIYRKWFESPIPPKGLNLNFPESDDIKALYRSPNDKAAE
jgi:hypothetical protein